MLSLSSSRPSERKSFQPKAVQRRSQLHELRVPSISVVRHSGSSSNTNAEQKRHTGQCCVSVCVFRVHGATVLGTLRPKLSDRNAQSYMHTYVHTLTHSLHAAWHSFYTLRARAHCKQGETYTSASKRAQLSTDTPTHEEHHARTSTYHARAHACSSAAATASVPNAERCSHQSRACREALHLLSYTWRSFFCTKPFSRQHNLQRAPCTLNVFGCLLRVGFVGARRVLPPLLSGPCYSILSGFYVVFVCSFVCLLQTLFVAVFMV